MMMIVRDEHYYFSGSSYDIFILIFLGGWKVEYQIESEKINLVIKLSSVLMGMLGNFYKRFSKNDQRCKIVLVVIKSERVFMNEQGDFLQTYMIDQPVNPFLRQNY